MIATSCELLDIFVEINTFCIFFHIQTGAVCIGMVLYANGVPERQLTSQAGWNSSNCRCLFHIRELRLLWWIAKGCLMYKALS